MKKPGHSSFHTYFGVITAISWPKGSFDKPSSNHPCPKFFIVNLKHTSKASTTSHLTSSCPYLSHEQQSISWEHLQTNIVVHLQDYHNLSHSVTDDLHLCLMCVSVHCIRTLSSSFVAHSFLTNFLSSSCHFFTFHPLSLWIPFFFSSSSFFEVLNNS